MPKTNPSDLAAETPEIDPQILEMRKLAAKRFQVHSIQEQKQAQKKEMDQFESEHEKKILEEEARKKEALLQFSSFKDKVDSFHRKLEKFAEQNAFCTLFASPQYLSVIQEFINKLKEIIEICGQQPFFGDKDKQLLDDCKFNFKYLIDNQSYLSMYCYDQYAKQLISDFRKFSTRVNENYRKCIQDLNDFVPKSREQYKEEMYSKFKLPKCTLVNDKWDKTNDFFDRSRTYAIENNNCVRVININKLKDIDLWFVELKALEKNADINDEGTHCTETLKKQLADALKANGLSPDDANPRESKLCISGTLEEMRSIWPLILLTIGSLEGEHLFKKDSNVQLLFDSVSRRNNASNATNANTSQRNHPFWANNPTPLDKQIASLNLNNEIPKMQRP